MKSRLLIFPHQIFENHPGFAENPDEIVLIEDSLFFGDDRYPAKFHQQKLWLHRASMRRFDAGLQTRGFTTRYVPYDPSRPLTTVLSDLGECEQYTLCDPTDFILGKRLRQFATEKDVDLTLLPTPGFLNTRQQNQDYREGKKRWFMADFYKAQRRRLNILMEEDDKPVGGKWSFDEDNRKKVPKKMLAQLPSLPTVRHDDLDRQAKQSVEQDFNDNPGNLDSLIYPTSHDAARHWLTNFLENRFNHFGAYEDAIVSGESWLWHSVLTPLLNIGLLTPTQIVDETLQFSNRQEVPLNSLEGFLRQVIGWREFMRATYEDLGVRMRNTNHWEHHRPIPAAFYNATTGIPPLDDTISRILNTGYCHHIERLMVLGGFMFLCEFDPQDIYLWFMEMFVDSYDWVMVPNAYAMSQNADGGLITTKPYFSGSAYIRKMSHYKKEPWCDIWDGLYWRWIWNHVDQLSKNPRWAMMCSSAKRMDQAKRNRHLANADAYLKSLDHS